MKFSHRSTAWLLIAGATYAVLARGWVGIAVPGLMPGAGYNPLINGDGTLGSVSADLEFDVDTVLLGIAMCWTIVGLARRSPHAIRALGLVYLVDCAVYIGSVAFVPAASAAGGISRFAIIALLQAPLIAIAIRLVAIREPATNSAP